MSKDTQVVSFADTSVECRKGRLAGVLQVLFSPIVSIELKVSTRTLAHCHIVLNDPLFIAVRFLSATQR